MMTFSFDFTIPFLRSGVTVNALHKGAQPDDDNDDDDDDDDDDDKWC